MKPGKSPFLINAWRLVAFSLPPGLNTYKELRAAHQKAKEHLLDYVNRETNLGLALDIFTLWFARRGDIKVAYLANYETWLARLLTGGVDFWFNTLQPPNEASGTSGMKAAINGVPSLGTMDGWWLEGHIDNFTGWSIDVGAPGGLECVDDADCLYRKLEKLIIPRYYRERSTLLNAMYGAITLNGSFFNTQRMVQQYVVKAYL